MTRSDVISTIEPLAKIPFAIKGCTDPVHKADGIFAHVSTQKQLLAFFRLFPLAQGIVFVFVSGHDEKFLFGTRQSDVKQAHLLCAKLSCRFFLCVRLHRSDGFDTRFAIEARDRHAVLFIQQILAFQTVSVETLCRINQKDHRKFQALAAVNRHDADDVIACFV